jgi:hypothetical protein
MPNTKRRVVLVTLAALAGAVLGGSAELNPQPEPPGIAAHPLNPQPEPPGLNPQPEPPGIA